MFVPQDIRWKITTYLRSDILYGTELFNVASVSHTFCIDLVVELSNSSTKYLPIEKNEH